MVTCNYDPPEQDEIEVSLFGPGYGEALVLHIGGGNWILVDSCIRPESNTPAALEYFGLLNIDMEDAVKLIVASHWHDDHIRGLSDLFIKCAHALFSMPIALKEKEFLTLIRLYDRFPKTTENSGLKEFIRIIMTLANRESNAQFKPPKYALADRLLYSNQIRLISDSVDAKVYALSPSDAAFQQSLMAFANLLPKFNSREYKSIIRVASPSPNHTSVVLWIEIGIHRILLGSDLENTNDSETGWTAILNNSQVVNNKAGVFKIPHHGSENAHNDTIWSRFLLDNPYSLLSPFFKGNISLPTQPDIHRINHFTNNAYITNPTRKRKFRWRDNVVRDFVKDVTPDIYNVHSGWGHIRLRKKISDTNPFWQVQLSGDAEALNVAV